eukprot:9417122-Heterocapsa_arctica.AAC.1
MNEGLDPGQAMLGHRQPTQRGGQPVSRPACQPAGWSARGLCGPLCRLGLVKASVPETREQTHKVTARLDTCRSARHRTALW